VPEYVDVQVDFDVDVTKDLPPADAPHTTPTVKAGAYHAVAIRHWPTKLIPSSPTIRSGDIWYGPEDGDDVVWVRAVETTPDKSQVSPSG
jgi:hypothetical protein